MFAGDDIRRLRAGALTPVGRERCNARDPESPEIRPQFPVQRAHRSRPYTAAGTLLAFGDEHKLGPGTTRSLVPTGLF